MHDISERTASERQLLERATQQAVVAEFGQRALEGAAVADLMRDGIALVSDQLHLELAAIFQSIPEERQLISTVHVGYPDPGPLRAAAGGWLPGGRDDGGRAPAGGRRLDQRGPLRLPGRPARARGTERPERDHRRPRARLRCALGPDARAALVLQRGRQLRPGRGQRAGGRHRALGERGAEPPRRASRPAHRPPQPHAAARPPRARARPQRPQRGSVGGHLRRPRPASSSSTTPSATTPATSSSSCSRRGSPALCAWATPSPASAATSSSCSARTSRTPGGAISARRPHRRRSGGALRRRRQRGLRQRQRRRRRIRTPTPPPSRCCATPTPPCTAPRRAAAPAPSSSTAPSATRSSGACAWRPRCAAPCERGELRVAYQPIVSLRDGAPRARGGAPALGPPGAGRDLTRPSSSRSPRRPD